MSNGQLLVILLPLLSILWALFRIEAAIRDQTAALKPDPLAQDHSLLELEASNMAASLSAIEGDVSDIRATLEKQALDEDIRRATE